MSNPLAGLQTAAKSSIRHTVEWAFGPDTARKRRYAGMSDPVLDRVPIDTLRRAAFHSVFGTLFDNADRFPYLVPDKTLKTVIGKLSKNMFPKGTVIKAEADAVEQLLMDIIKHTRLHKKTFKIVQESALMGYSGLRSVYDKELGRWLLEVKPKEYLVVETREGNPEEITAIGMEWPIERPTGPRGQMQRYWQKERWTLTEYQQWPEQRETPMGKPDFSKIAPASTEPNTYGELPITLIPHYSGSGVPGEGVVQEEEILTVKALIRLRHKRHFGHLQYMDPNPVAINRANPGDPIDVGIGNVIDIQSVDESAQADFKLLEYAGMPESVKDEFYDHICALYDAAGLKAPCREEVFKPGTDVAGVALRLLDKDDAEEIDGLRENGYSLVLRHLEKILRMGARLNLPDYGGINPDDPETWMISAVFPEFFTPTEQDNTARLLNMKQSYLPAKFMARQIAAMWGIEDEAMITEIERLINEERAMMKAEVTNPIG